MGFFDKLKNGLNKKSLLAGINSSEYLVTLEKLMKICLKN